MKWNTESRLELVNMLQKMTERLMNMRFFSKPINKEEIRLLEQKVKILNDYITETYD
tara:strand:+ start:533 stop:703 length:171 start_codon:yes stop_codon:yes gene_type:complete